MFIDVTRHGGGRVLRVAVAAIAYIDACDGGAVLHLVGGQSLRTIEDPAEIEARATPVFVTAELVSEPRLTADDIVEAYARIAELRTAPAAPTSAPDPAPASTPPSPPAEGEPEKLAGKRQFSRGGR